MSPSIDDRMSALCKELDEINGRMKAALGYMADNHVTKNTPLVDREGFPRSDIDVWRVRQSRAQIARDENDKQRITNEIEKILHIRLARKVAIDVPTTIMSNKSPRGKIDRSGDVGCKNGSLHSSDDDEGILPEDTVTEDPITAAFEQTPESRLENHASEETTSPQEIIHTHRPPLARIAGVAPDSPAEIAVMLTPRILRQSWSNIHLDRVSKQMI